jgi:hypothetical protein
MQLLPALTRDSAAASRERPAGRHLPYARHVDDHTIETRDGLLMQVIQVRGLLFETADTDEINYRKQLRDASLQAIGSSRYAIHHHIIRREAEVSLDADYRDNFSRRLDEAWRAKLSARRLYINDLFLTLIRRPLQGKVGSADRLRRKFGKVVEQLDTRRSCDLQQLGQPVGWIVSRFEADLVEEAHRSLAAGKNRQKVLFAGQVEPRDHAVVAVLDQEAMRAVGNCADELELVLGEAKAAAIFTRLSFGIGHEDLRRRLLDDRAGDPALEGVLSALRREAHDSVAFADRFFPVLDPAHEHLVVERLPAFVDNDDRRASVEPLFDPVE